MEKKQLNFSAPLLSARRYSSPNRSEPRKNISESEKKKKNQVVKLAAVPFLWEQIPGRAKGDSRRLPQAAAAEKKEQQRFTSGELTSFYRSQNRLSGELNRKGSRFLSGELSRPSSIPIPIPIPIPSVTTMDYDGLLFDRNYGSLSETDDDDDCDTATFSDAVDAQLESYSMKCSTNGLSAPAETLSSSSQSAVLENREFMINRFLPAAKAMTLDSSPQYYTNTTTKSQLVVVEQPPPSNPIIPKIVKSPVHTQKMTLYSSSTAMKSKDDYEDDDDSEDDDARNRSNHTVKSCGFFPWFCSKNAMRLLNPVTAMKLRTKNALASATKVIGRNLGRSISKQQQQQVSTSRVHKISFDMEEEETHYNYKPRRPMFYSGELPSHARNTDSHARNPHLSPYRNYRRPESPRSPYNNQTAYFIVPNNYSGPILSNRRNYPPPPGSPVMEKTLYVDSKITKSRQSSGRIDILKARGIKNANSSSDFATPKNEDSPITTQKKKDSALPINQKKKDSASTTAPPLPKSPSESWLSRNLNSASPRNSFGGAAGAKLLHSRKQSPVKTRPLTLTTPGVIVKWDTCV